MKIWLNNQDIRAALGIPIDFPGGWEDCNDITFEQFMRTGDGTRSSLPALNNAIAGLPNLKVLLYAGDQDLTCPFTSIQRIAREVVYPGQAAFRARIDRPEGDLTSLRDSNRKVYGSTVQVGNLMYARIYEAGHMINENRPREAKELFEKWVGGFEFDP